MKKSMAFCVAVGLSVAANAAEVSKYADPFWGCGQVDNPESQRHLQNPCKFGKAGCPQPAAVA